MDQTLSHKMSLLPITTFIFVIHIRENYILRMKYNEDKIENKTQKAYLLTSLFFIPSSSLMSDLFLAHCYFCHESYSLPSEDETKLFPLVASHLMRTECDEGE